MITALQIIAIVSAVLSSAFFVFTYRGWMKALKTPPVRSDLRPVSIIIAAHNENDSLPELLTALIEQDYPHELLEIIVVDDRSTDGTSDTALRYTDTLPLRVIRIDTVPEGISPKKQALNAGITAARHELLLLTDADCLPRPSWIRGMSATLGSDMDVVIGLAPLSRNKSSASSYAAFESRRTAALAAAAAASGLPYMASGRSWGFTRTAYDACGGLPELYSHLGGDDDLLLQQMLRHDVRVGVCMRQDSIVLSDAARSWSELTQQKLRHYSVSTAYRGRPALLLGLFVVSEIMTPIAAIALTILMPGPERILPLLMWLWKLWYDSGFLVHAFRWTKGETGRLGLAFWEGFHIFFSAITGLTSYLKPPRW